jgi:hypothetical protein
LAVCALHIQPAWRRSSMIRWIFVWIGLDLWSLIKNSKSKFKN